MELSDATRSRIGAILEAVLDPVMGPIMDSFFHNLAMISRLGPIGYIHFGNPFAVAFWGWFFLSLRNTYVILRFFRVVGR